jgi:hypothetical protein
VVFFCVSRLGIFGVFKYLQSDYPGQAWSLTFDQRNGNLLGNCMPCSMEVFLTNLWNLVVFPSPVNNFFLFAAGMHSIEQQILKPQERSRRNYVM